MVLNIKDPGSARDVIDESITPGQVVVTCLSACALLVMGYLWCVVNGMKGHLDLERDDDGVIRNQLTIRNPLAYFRARQQQSYVNISSAKKREVVRNQLIGQT